MKKFLPIFFIVFVSPAFGQSSEPYLINSGAGGLTCTYSNNVVSGNSLVAAFFWSSTNNTPSTPTDSVGTIFTQKTIDISGVVKWTFYTGTANGSGADTITFSNTGSTAQVSVCSEFNFAGISFTVDAAKLDNFSAQSTRSTSITTTQDGDLLFSFCYINDNVDCSSTTDINYNVVHNPSKGAAFRILGTLGSTTSTWVVGTSDDGAIGVIAFKPTTQDIKSPTTLPSAATTSSYKYQLLEEGMTASVTWSVSVGKLPLGLSLNSSTGVISGTPTNSSSGFTIQATDGTHTVSKAMTLNVGTSLATITHLQDSSTAGIFPGNVTSGSLITVIKVNAPNTGGSNFGSCTDTLGTLYHLVTTTFQQNGTNMIGFFAGIAPSGGADTVSCTGGSGPVASEFSNTQTVWDYNDFNSAAANLYKQVSSSSLTTSTITPLSANSLIYAGWTTENNVTQTITAPCNQIVNRLASLSSTCYQIGTTVTGYSENMTTGTASGQWGAFISGAFRPSISGTAPLPSSGNSSEGQIY